ncbi:HEPN domain-containing protein [Nocardia sp. NPDC056064]|uniref:HEPN domain-containing protein n=1 Tax=Nocardia sp. NPDC056064 TaxID=3345701 RepID=UPI0035D9BFF1
MNPAWRRCIDRFDEVKYFIAESAVQPRGRSASYRVDLYGSWVLLAYSACQYALDEIGRGCMEFLGSRYKYPSAMPPKMLALHQQRTLDRVRRAAEEADPHAPIKSLIQGIHSNEWSSQSDLLSLDRNVWPNVVRGWLRRLGATDSDLGWMTEPVPGRTETYESRMASLVAERNPIAHGQSASNVLTAPLMQEWVSDCACFMEKCAMTAAFRLSFDHSPRLRLLGTIDRKVKLGKNTVAIAEIRHTLRVGDHILLASRGERKKIARVDSIMSENMQKRIVGIGHRRVAICLSTPHQGNGIYMVP